MAEAAIHLPIFIASSNDLIEERKITYEVIKDLQESVNKQKLLLSTYMWEKDARATSLSSPQESIDKLLTRCELAIVIFGSRLGTGTMHELNLAREMVYKGATDDVLIYFKEDKNNIHSNENKEIIKGLDCFHFDFEDSNHFRKILRSHLLNWMKRWMQIPLICEFTFRNSYGDSLLKNYSGENEITKLKRKWSINENGKIEKLVGQCAIKIYQNYGIHAFQQSFVFTSLNTLDFLTSSMQRDNKYSPLVQLKANEYSFREIDWFLLFCAIGLKESILENNVDAVSSYPYINLVHQFLNALIPSNNEKWVDILIKWLVNHNGITHSKPIARNFAAYELGMLKAKKAEADLARVACYDSGSDVRLYSILSLGRMRSRSHLYLLLEAWNSSTIDERTKILLGQSITNTIGITNYTL